MSNEPGLNLALDALEDAHGLSPAPEDIYDAFSAWVSSTGKQMYPHQDEALLNIVSGDHVIVSTPTGSGKSMIAMQALFTGLATGRTAYYTAPLKALVSEKFFELIGHFGAHNVGMVTGDSSINAGAPIICATAEILANIALREGDQADVGMVVMDEFHFYDDPQRGWAWQVPLLTLPQAQQILLSATLGDTTKLTSDLTRRTNRPVSIVDDAVRPVPLHFSWSTEPIGEVIKELVATHMAPVYVVHFSQRDAVSQALALQSMAVASKEQKERIAAALASFTFSPGFGKVLSKLLRAGIGIHHAGLLPRYRRLVERLAQAGLLNVICGTDTLGVGINVPIRTVLMTSLTKFDGTKQRHITAREFHQIAGRAGRAGYDTVGYVVVQAPEHEIENARRLRKAGDDPAKVKRVQKVKAPEGTISWSENTFNTLLAAQPETLTSRMRVDHSLILNLLQRPNPITAAKTVLCDNHEPHRERNTLLRKAITIYQSLRTAGVITHEDRDWRTEHGDENAIHFTRDVPSDFALNSPLAPFALAAFDLLDMDSPSYALDVVSIIEAVSEDPTPALYAQQRQARGELIGKLKADGVEYDERMVLVDEVTWPKPLADLLEPALETYAKTNPWVRGQELKPKSVVRQLIEEGLTFSEFISRYDLARSEGVLLRYITDVYRAMRQTIPLAARTDEVKDIVDWLARLVRSIDSSLLDEWEALADGRITLAELNSLGSDDSVQGEEAAFGADDDGTVAFTRNKHALRVAIRNHMFYRIELLDREDYEELERLDGSAGWDADRWADAIAPYFDEYDFLGTDQAARGTQFFAILEDPSFADLLQAGMDNDEASALLETHSSGRVWLALQILDSGDDAAAWGLWAIVDLDASDEANKLVLRPIQLGER
ncbi:DEAD/DEAH box helicase [Arcanobacterium phocae]|uniref:Helicase conserved C-terminal domain-containing protein n=1 Tax=Arcanobacterium phocae TaxID=131112 RepID=A0A1H2LP49_9ACTO|nr:DEAD/DEAH box helicase [Arcanobacterium phocae]SDU82699.1 Helicase conserved C-terminal domain-containing protein [Arcanobacterium phocae]